MAAPDVQREIRARCGRVVLLAASAAGVSCLAAGGSPLRLPLAVASGGVLAGTWAHRLLKPVTRTGSSRVSRTVAALKELDKLLPIALVLVLCGIATAWARIGPVTTKCTYAFEEACLQEQNLLLLFIGFWNGMIFFIREFALSEPGVKFPLVQQKKFIRIKFAITPTIMKAIKMTLITVPIVTLIYYRNGNAYRDFVFLFGSLQEDEPLDGLFSIFSFPLLSRILYHSFLFYFVTYFTIEFFDIYLTERFIFPIEKVENHLTLSNGIRNQNLLLAKLASRDLLTLSRKDLMRRKCIFSLSIPGGHPTNWRNISGPCLDCVNSYADRIAAITQTVKTEPELKVHHKTNTPPQLRSYLTSPNLQNNLRNLSSDLSEPNAKHQEKTFKEAIKEELDTLWATLCNKPGISFFFGELSEVKLKQLTNDGDAVGKISLALSQLVAASLSEDSYGIVQDDLSTILQTLMRLKLSLDKLTKSGVVNKKNLKQDRAVMESLTEIKSAVRRSIYLIRITFKDHINNFVLDSDTSIALQSFIDFREC